MGNMKYFLILDVPFSLATDLVILPYDLITPIDGNASVEPDGSDRESD